MKKKKKVKKVAGRNISLIIKKHEQYLDAKKEFYEQYLMDVEQEYT